MERCRAPMDKNRIQAATAQDDRARFLKALRPMAKRRKPDGRAVTKYALTREDLASWAKVRRSRRGARSHFIYRSIMHLFDRRNDPHAPMVTMN